MYAKYSEIVLHIWLFDTVSLRTFSSTGDCKLEIERVSKVKLSLLAET